MSLFEWILSLFLPGRNALKSIKGKWGFSASGIIFEFPNPAIPRDSPAVALGVIDFDGNGGCTITDSINFKELSKVLPPGASPPLSRTSLPGGTYDVDPSTGMGTILVEFPVPSGAPRDIVPLSFVIIDNIREIRFIRTDSNAVASGVAKKQ